MLYTTPACFSTFFRSIIVPTPVENSYFSVENSYFFSVLVTVGITCPLVYNKQRGRETREQLKSRVARDAYRYNSVHLIPIVFSL